MSSSTDWNAFFLKAGIPSRYAAKYAVIFNDHRIQDDMLKDLSKEILYDMGIKTMGDVIAIMRHANEVDEEKSRNRILSARSHSSEGPVKKQVKRVVVEEKADSAAAISTSLSRRLGPTHAAPVAAPTVRNVSLPVREPLIKRVISVPTASERVIRLPASSSGSVFDRLGGTAGESETTSTVTSGSVLRGMVLTASSMPTAAKATATVRPTRGTPYSVKDRLGAGSRGAGVREVVSSNLKLKSDPLPLSARLQALPLKKSIFDRLGA